MKVCNINDVLAEHSATHGEDTALIFLDERGQQTSQLTYADLFERAGSFAARFARYERQARIVIIVPTSAEFPSVLFGCFLAGKIAVPLAVPNNHRIPEVMAILEDCCPSCIVTTSTIRTVLRAKLCDTQWSSLEILAVEELTDPEKNLDWHAAEDAIALLQYTSGSTSSPKGVIVRHSNIMANERMINEAFGLDRTTTVVGWTPLHHDQGLIGNLLQSLYTGTKCVLMPPIAFLRSPLLWLQTITKYRAHTSGGPNFAFDMCVARYRPTDAAGLDLSSWKIAFNGAEPICASTIRRFNKTFEPHGFSPHAMFPCYGMAEATLFVSGGPAGRGPSFLTSKECREQLGAELVCSGSVHPDMSVLICRDGADEAKMTSLEGEICITGPNVTSGYWNRQPDDYLLDESSGLRYLRTGDVGFLRDEGLYITGRRKELMIVRGRNIYPYDIERTIAESHQHLQKGACAVFSSPREGSGEEVFAVQEVERAARHKLLYTEVAALVKTNVVRRHDVMLKRLFFVTPGFIPRTTSGKIKRARLAEWVQSCPPDGERALEGVLAEC
jgi:acyl-CoA synthetase (AMP-forming)/AMP-acid ligase II